MKTSSMCIAVVANQAAIPFGHAEKILRWAAGYDKAENVMAANNTTRIAYAGRVVGVFVTLESLGAEHETINRALAAINEEV